MRGAPAYTTATKVSVNEIKATYLCPLRRQQAICANQVRPRRNVLLPPLGGNRVISSLPIQVLELRNCSSLIRSQVAGGKAARNA